MSRRLSKRQRQQNERANRLIGQELGLNIGQTAQFMDQVDKLLPYWTEPEGILAAIQALEKNERSPLQVADQVLCHSSVGRQVDSLTDVYLSAIESQAHRLTGRRFSFWELKTALAQIGPRQPYSEAIKYLASRLPAGNISVALGMDLLDALAVYHNISHRLGEEPDKVQVLEALGRLSEEDRNPRGLQNTLIVMKTVRELQIDFDSALRLRDVISSRVGFIVDNDRILRALRVLYHKEKSLEELVNLISITDELDSESPTVIGLIRTLRRLRGDEVSHTEIKAILIGLEDPQVNEEQLRQHVEAHRLATALNTGLQAARSILDEVRLHLGRTVQVDEILVAIDELSAQDWDSATMVVALHAQELMQDLAIDLPHAMRLAEEFEDGKRLTERVVAELGYPFASEAMTKAIMDLDPASLSLSSIAETVELNEIARRFGVTKEEAIALAQRMAEVSDLALGPGDVIAASEFYIDTEDPFDYVSSLVAIARALEMTILEAGQFVQSVRRSGGQRYAFTAQAISLALQYAGGRGRDPADVAAYIRADQLLHAVGMGSTAAELHSQLVPFLIGEPDYSDLLEALQHTGPESIPGGVITYLNQKLVLRELSARLGVGLKKVDSLPAHLLQRTGKELDHSQALAIVKQIPQAHRSFDNSLDLITLVFLFGMADWQEIANLVASLTKERDLRGLFWDLFAALLKDQAATLSDARTIRWLAQLPRRTWWIDELVGSSEHILVTQGRLKTLAARIHPRARTRLTTGTHMTKFRQLCDASWGEICSEKRQYEVPSLGRAELLATDRIHSLTGLKSVRFIAEGVRAPGVFLQFKFDTEPQSVGMMRISPEGKAEGFHELVDNRLFITLIEVVAFTYYRDLVIPDLRMRPTSTAPPRHHRQTTKPVQTAQAMRPPQRRPPRQSHPLLPKRPIHLSEWYAAQTRARHHVIGHLRFIRSGFRADWVKQAQARAAGVDIPLDYTWVVEHERGDPQRTGPVILDERFDLTKHILFSPPRRAVEEMDAILGY
jgi:hypothetical protein